ncbi:MAG: hypothetical protein A2029_09000 [Chloroflexi bacterium RBG_19FT_COMBO_47_9]|nr:MAG: hypothetical protein A2029_09000 [Chloroflexi bacterium RBG_19FT_COMBO_47_9]
MLVKINQLIDVLSEFFAQRKGLIPLIGLAFVVVNLIFQIFPQLGWLASSDLFLHLGVILAIIGFMLAWAL